MTRSGWLAIFMGGLMVGDPSLLPLLAVVVLPAWLVVTGRPEMVVEVPEPVAAAPSAGANAAT